MKVLLGLLAGLTLFNATMAQHPTLSYTLGMSRPSTHLFEVEITFANLDDDTALVLMLPVWRPGRYVVLDLAGGIVSFEAVDGSGHPLVWKKTGKSAWMIETKRSAEVVVRYRILADEFALRTRGLNSERGFVDGSAVFMFAEKYRWLPLTLTVHPFPGWHVTTPLDPLSDRPNTFVARNYDHLADSPLEIGTQKDFVFHVRGKQHILSIAGEGSYDSARLVADIAAIVEQHAAFWGELPYDRYVFFLALSANGGGGTEHENSCVMGARPFLFQDSSAYKNFLGLVSHEFFHTWNVKRLRPAGITSYVWMEENYVEELWVAEGTTSYYDDLLLVRAGFLSEQEYRTRLSKAINDDRARPGNARQSLAEASFDAWIKYWKSSKHALNYETDYYSRGAAVSFVLDMTIRRVTENCRSLDDVLRTIYRRCATAGRGYTNADLQAVCEEVAGTSFKTFFEHFVYGARPLPWEEALAVVGLETVPQAAEQTPWLGITTMDEGQKTRITSVVAGSPAFDAGVDVNDELVALNGYRVRSSDVNARLRTMREGERVTLTVFRDDRLRTFDVVLQLPSVTPINVVKMQKPTPLQAITLASWLSLPTSEKDSP
ncbi:MAG: peptidase M61 [Ignavibacteria bacterium]